jgi:hypothetical protein
MSRPTHEAISPTATGSRSTAGDLMNRVDEPRETTEEERAYDSLSKRFAT